MTSVPFVTGAAVVSGPAAKVLGSFCRRALDAGVFDSLPTEVFDDVAATVAAVELAAQSAVVHDRVAANGNHDGNSETPRAPASAHSADELSIDDAARVLGVGVRRARQLAPALGRKVAGVWLIDRHLLEREAARRAS